MFQRIVAALLSTSFPFIAAPFARVAGLLSSSRPSCAKRRKGAARTRAERRALDFAERNAAAPAAETPAAVPAGRSVSQGLSEGLGGLRSAPKAFNARRTPPPRCCRHGVVEVRI